jgi:hypothetical protein
MYRPLTDMFDICKFRRVRFLVRCVLVVKWRFFNITSGDTKKALDSSQYSDEDQSGGDTVFSN